MLGFYKARNEYIWSRMCILFLSKKIANNIQTMVVLLYFMWLHWKHIKILFNFIMSGASFKLYEYRTDVGFDVITIVFPSIKVDSTSGLWSHRSFNLQAHYMANNKSVTSFVVNVFNGKILYFISFNISCLLHKTILILVRSLFLSSMSLIIDRWYSRRKSVNANKRTE